MEIWKKINTIATIKSKWVTIKCESYIVNKKSLEYWSVDRASSIIIVVVQNDNFILLENNYRVGVGEYTLDFPGGRNSQEKFKLSAQYILENELNVQPKNYTLSELSLVGYLVDSSFSSQKVYYYQAVINKEVLLSPKLGIKRYNMKTDVQNLLMDVKCLQCRHAVMEYLFKGKKNEI